MDRGKIIEALSSIGVFMAQFKFAELQKEDLELNDLFYEGFSSAIYKSKVHNGWFEESQVRRSVSAVSEWLNPEVLMEWSSKYTWNDCPKKVAIIMAGNIPLVGFHDFVCTLISGNNLLVKLSSYDNILLPLITKMLIHLNPKFDDKVVFTESIMEDFDAVIATGSDNTARYFNHYFGKYPHIIRKNRNSVAVLAGKESKDDLIALGDDVFAYYGLGCRNVSKVYVPKDYNFDLLFEAFYEYKDILDNKKYANNFDYYRALFLMGGNDMLENGFLLLREDTSLSSPISMLHYETYDCVETLQKHLETKAEQIQCLVSALDLPNSFSLGQAQCPAVKDYADGVDTMEFLTNL